ncbi:Phenylalanyl-tRNA synthetase beta chain [hydrothermal vent metagenome]|uniref:Phenylalanine--tRNA ligase beta subunit n=1 Tax=hydrothermal vent metagenome TaxID=652676 RepID=A0A1W1EI55_9ZZZZ
MIVTKSWLGEFLDLDRISNDDIYKSLNSIGLEVDSLEEITIPKGVVVGEIKSCEKHPNADKLNVCSIDIGRGENVQIVCGAKNVVDAKFVAVATIGTKLGDDFEIKEAVLRDVDSFGMVCSSTELGLPQINDGIMILDDSIGELIIGKELSEYPTIADTIIELELTANRGDCLSINGVARDLSVGLNRKLKSNEFKPKSVEKLSIDDVALIDMKDFLNAELSYSLVTAKDIDTNLLITLRNKFVGIEPKDRLDSLIRYAIHSTGVILRAYDASLFKNAQDKVEIELSSREEGIVEILANDKVVSTLGVSQENYSQAINITKKILLEASYIEPSLLVDAVSSRDYVTDDKYYNTSRGSEPELTLGIEKILTLLQENSNSTFLNGTIDVSSNRKKVSLKLSNSDINDIIGMDIERSKNAKILKKLGFEVDSRADDTLNILVPHSRPDIKNIYDITEEIVRIIGIDNIPAKPFIFQEKMRLNSTSDRYRAKKEIKNRAITASFYETLSYIFASSDKLDKYGFDRVQENLELLNPITQEFDALRTTMMTNLLDSVERNISYGKKSIALFEIGTIFNSNREEHEVISFVFSGAKSNESIINHGKPLPIDFASFVEKLGSVIGNFELVPTTQNNALIHPYQSADIIIDGKVSGYLSMLHPNPKEDYNLFDTFIAQVDLDAILPKHINAHQISNFQGVYKDLSLVIDENISAKELMDSIKSLNIEMLKDFYIVDIYQDEKLGTKKSISLRFFIQSMDKTLKDKDINKITSNLIKELEKKFEASLR